MQNDSSASLTQSASRAALPVSAIGGAPLTQSAADAGLQVSAIAGGAPLTQSAAAAGLPVSAAIALGKSDADHKSVVSGQGSSKSDYETGGIEDIPLDLKDVVIRGILAEVDLLSGLHVRSGQLVVRIPKSTLPDVLELAAEKNALPSLFLKNEQMHVQIGAEICVRVTAACLRRAGQEQRIFAVGVINGFSVGPGGFSFGGPV
jgi:hypothetical protein